MKNAPIQKSNESACDKDIFSQPDLFGDAAPTSPALVPFYPPSRNSVISHVLMLLLDGNKLDHLNVWIECGSSRAAAHIHELSRKYHWPVKTETWIVGTSDGRTAGVERYFFEQEAITKAFERGANVFIEQTKQARAVLRQTAPEKRMEAVAANFARAERRQA